jgi:hypothetical protein
MVPAGRISLPFNWLDRTAESAVCRGVRARSFLLIILHPFTVSILNNTHGLELLQKRVWLLARLVNCAIDPEFWSEFVFMV